MEERLWELITNIERERERERERRVMLLVSTIILKKDKFRYNFFKCCRVDFF